MAEEGEILSWLNPNKKMSTDEIGEAKRLSGEYFSEGTIQYQLFNEPNTGYITGKVGTLSDGTKVVARQGSKTGGATLEIKVSNSKVYKIRY